MNTNNDKLNECIVCQDDINSTFIKYQHTCGIYDIHQVCLDEWFMKNSHNCIICRNNILSPTNSEISSSRENSPISNYECNYDADTESNNSSIIYSNLNETPNNVIENNNIVDYQSIICYHIFNVLIIFFAFIFILVILFIIF